MKRFAFALAMFLTASAFAQPAGPQGINASLLRFFGDVKAFTAHGEVRLTDSQGKEISTLPVTMALLDGKLRTEMDMSQMKGAAMPAEAVAMLKQTGMDRMHMIIAPERKNTAIIYPGLQSYADVPIAEQELSAAKVETTEMGKESIDGHPCVKQKLISTDAKGNKQEALIWAATDLKNFPLQLEMKQAANSINIHFNAPSLEKPDGKLFVLPANYTKYDSLQALMQAAMMKMLGGQK